MKRGRKPKAPEVPPSPVPAYTLYAAIVMVLFALWFAYRMATGG